MGRRHNMTGWGGQGAIYGSPLQHGAGNDSLSACRLKLPENYSGQLVNEGAARG